MSRGYGGLSAKSLLPWQTSHRADMLPRLGLQCPLLAQSGHLDMLNQCPLLGVRHTQIDITCVFDFADLLPPRLPPGRICPLFAKHPPTMPLAHFVGDAGAR